jgi:hypothetical protein
MRTMSIVILGLSLIACGGGSLEPVDEAAVLKEIRTHYDSVAIEEGGLCRRPVMGGIAGYEVLDGSGDELKVRVRYAYSDPTAKFAAQCKRLGVRTFTVKQVPDGFEVVSMTGGQGIGLRIEKMLTPHW